ncbi:alpha/beta hydrolase [Schumannella luteola]|uniref:Pimeloyl-ACP methyl ester carboxylesterase n=1 Tax=Schumannella luteola TaxID=472059 RepID=A0A852YEV5_9MICO|nr:alpha/beta hydrolase [Schumannella luteola]NYG99834.1 pimeloyl-ACP methyl ester carboxylesterase [Schumannella luteola]TPX02232.1 alpha/beta hydrolase [Schumannella luteola]
MEHRIASTPVLDIAYLEHGPADGPVVVLLHGFPYDVRAYDEVAPALAESGLRVIVPWLRGYGPTRFRSPMTLRSGEQGALAQDLLDLLDALGIARAALVGYDWGGRAACVVAALRPERVTALVTVDGYNVHDLAVAGEPAPAAAEKPFWYQYFLQTERGRRALETDRDGFCRLLWRDWSPEWADAERAFTASAASLRNPDFVDVVTHSYRVRHALVPGDPRYADLTRAIATQPPITVPTIVLSPLADGLDAGIPGEPDADPAHFTDLVEVIELSGVGHNVPQEAPDAVVSAVRRLLL